MTSASRYGWVVAWLATACVGYTAPAPPPPALPLDPAGEALLLRTQKNCSALESGTIRRESVLPWTHNVYSAVSPGSMAQAGVDEVGLLRKRCEAVGSFSLSRLGDSTTYAGMFGLNNALEGFFNEEADRIRFSSMLREDLVTPHLRYQRSELERERRRRPALAWSLPRIEHDSDDVEYDSYDVDDIGMTDTVIVVDGQGRIVDAMIYERDTTHAVHASPPLRSRRSSASAPRQPIVLSAASVAAATRPAVMSPDEMIEWEYNRLGTGRVAFTPPPRQSRVGRRDTLVLWISKDPNRPRPTVTVSTRGGVRVQQLDPRATQFDTTAYIVKDVRVSSQMRANLSGDAFRFRQIFPSDSSNLQLVSETDDTRWEWEFWPIRAGNEELLVSVIAVVSAGEKEVPKEFEVLREQMQIDVDRLASMRMWWEEQPGAVQNTLILLGMLATGGSVIAGGFYTWAKRKRKRPISREG